MSDIATHYRGKGIAGVELREALRRHARLLSVLDPDAAEALLKSRAFAQVEGGKLTPREEF